MSNVTRTIALGAAAFTASLAVVAQPAAPAAATAPSDRSAFDGYRPFSAGPVGDWRQANDTVGAIGGWRAYARENQRASPDPGVPGGAVAPAPATLPDQGSAPGPVAPAASGASPRPAAPPREDH